ncbi:hypothetical protein VTK73DRAFT_2390 [Phialemonium thermophilum]|uniref:Uncharacterized protein n=1 Tax=Phialemonium thermophilum TaxID=223376 RepID=A0ABR3VS90_9PEZI
MPSTAMPAAKRRRIEAAHEVLRQPFRSPVVRRAAESPGAPQTASGDGAPTATTTTSTTTSSSTPGPGRAGRQGLHLGTPSRPARGQQGRETPGRQPQRPPLPAFLRVRFAAGPSKDAPPTDRAARAVVSSRQAGVAPSGDGGGGTIDDEFQKVLAEARKAAFEARATAREIQQEVEMARQARRIEERSRAQRPGEEEVDGELQALVRKWRSSGRQAAEELLALAGDRIAGMGGAQAWREARKRRGERWRDGDEAERKRQGQDGEDAENEDHTGDYEEDDGTGPDSGEGAAEGHESSGEERTEFTIGMMLQSLGLDPEILRYDAVEERWRD